MSADKKPGACPADSSDCGNEEMTTAARDAPPYLNGASPAFQAAQEHAFVTFIKAYGLTSIMMIIGLMAWAGVLTKPAPQAAVDTLKSSVDTLKDQFSDAFKAYATANQIRNEALDRRLDEMKTTLADLSARGRGTEIVLAEIKGGMRVHDPEYLPIEASAPLSSPLPASRPRVKVKQVPSKNWNPALQTKSSP